MKKLLSIILAILMIVTTVPFAFAAVAEGDVNSVLQTQSDSGDECAHSWSYSYCKYCDEKMPSDTECSHKFSYGLCDWCGYIDENSDQSLYMAVINGYYESYFSQRKLIFYNIYGYEKVDAVYDSINEEEIKRKREKVYCLLSLPGTVGENKATLEEYRIFITEFADKMKNCLEDVHNVDEYVLISDATCTENAIKTGECTFCSEKNAVIEVADSALNHSFTKYEVTEEAKCGVEGKKVAACDNGCGETDEKAIEALNHSFTKYEVTEEAKCGVEGKKVAACDHGCGATDEKAIAALTHKDADGDYKCDNGCGHEFEKPAEPDTPDEPTDDVCDHLCHKGGFMGFIWKIVKFFWKLFKMNPVCECGAAHY